MDARRALFAVAFVVAQVEAGLEARTARAEAPQVVIAPFQARCFDDHSLAAAVRARLPAASVRVGASGRGARQEVTVEGQERLVLRVVARGVDGHELGREQRALPDADCAVLLEAAALIVARAATPLRFRDLEAPRHPSHAGGSREGSHETARHDGNPPPEVTPPVPTTPESPEVPREPTPTPRVEAPRVEPTMPEPTTPEPPRPPATPRVRRLPLHPVDLDLGAQWIFPLDGPPSTPLGDLALGLRVSRHLGVGLRAGVAAPWSAIATAEGAAAKVEARRVPLAAELRIDLPVWRGGFRLSVGPTVALWLVRSEGVLHPASAVVVEPGAELRVTYRFVFGRFILEAGLHGDVAFGVDRLTVAGLGEAVAHTPRVDLGPALAIGVRL